MAIPKRSERKRKEWYTAQIQRVNGRYIQVAFTYQGNRYRVPFGNFNQRAWEKVVTKLGLHVIDGIKMTVYNCRDTFITLQATPREDSGGNIIPGYSSTTIARWVGNSSEVIEKKYLDKLQIEAIRPASV